jgi:hypothetical protein
VEIMGFPFSPRGTGFGWVLLTGALTGCGSDASGTGGSNAGIGTACAEEEFVLGGTLGGQTVSHRGTVKGHAWIQTGSSNSLDATFDPSGSLHADWTSLVAEGQTTTITGGITMPAGTPRGGETLNSGAGSLTKLGDEVRFEYTELSVSVACIQAPCAGDPVEGSLQGCLHWKHIGP